MNLASYMSYKSHIFRKGNRGMTLIELLVVIAIFAIVAGIIMFSYGNFRSSVSLQNLANDISLAIRKAQSKAIGVGSSANSFTNGYGVHFSVDTNSHYPLSGSPKSFIMFNDRSDGLNPFNKLYDYTIDNSICSETAQEVGNECIDVLRITTNDKIVSICPNSGTVCDAQYVDIVFLRPNPDAYICADEHSSVGCSNPLNSVDIIIQNIQTGAIKTITVSKVGQISVK